MTEAQATQVQETAIEQLKRQVEDYDKNERELEEQERARENALPFNQRTTWRKRHMYRGWQLEPVIEQHADAAGMSAGEQAALIYASNMHYDTCEEALKQPNAVLMDYTQDRKCQKDGLIIIACPKCGRIGRKVYDQCFHKMVVVSWEPFRIDWQDTCELVEQTEYMSTTFNTERMKAFTVTELAVKFGYSRSTVLRDIRRGFLRANTKSGHYVVSEGVVEPWLRSRCRLGLTIEAKHYLWEEDELLDENDRLCDLENEAWKDALLGKGSKRYDKQ
jgi:hypothetical protein